MFRRLATRDGLTITVAEESVVDAVESVRGHRWISVDHRRNVDAVLLDALANLGVGHVSTRSVGVDHIDVDHAAQRGISVSTVEYSPNSVAEHTVMLILMTLRDARPMLRHAERGDFPRPSIRSRQLGDLTVGVIGAGRIGSAVIDLVGAFGCRVLIHDQRTVGVDRRVTLTQLLRHSDIVTLHTPYTAGTHHLLDRARLAMLPRGAVVINTARGGLIDTGALVDALACGHLGGAALDVVDDEIEVLATGPGTRAGAGTTIARLQDFPNVIISPHVAYYTDRALRDIVEYTLAECASVVTRTESTCTG